MGAEPQPLDAQAIEEMLGPRIAIDSRALQACDDPEEFDRLAFELYKEAAGIIGLSAHLYAEGQNARLTRNQAVCAGLLVRICKFMVVVVQLSAGADRGEVIFALNRCMLESAVNLRFLLAQDEDRFFDQFVLFSLGPERELHDLIHRNIEARGGQRLPIEERMLRSIERTCRLSGARIEEVERRPGDWGGGLRERLRALGQEELYLAVQRLPSHAIHGSWVDLVLHHVKEAEGGFAPDESWTPVDSRLMLPICRLLLPAASEYVAKFFEPTNERGMLLARVDDVLLRMSEVETAHEAMLGRQ